MKNPELSVIITVYNKEKYIGQTIESVLCQTYQDFEVIVVDDGSTDKSRSIISSFKDDRIKCVYQKNTGLPASARNRGIERSCGKFIVLLDGDDTWLPTKLERTLDVFSILPEIDIVCHDLKLRGENSKTIKRTHLGPYPEDMYEKLLWDSNCLVVSTAALKREIFFEENFWFDEDKRLFSVEDYDFWLRLAESKKFNFYYLTESLAEHTVSERGIVLNDIERNAENLLYLFDENVAKHDFGNASKKILIKKRRSSIMRGAGISHNYIKQYSKSLHWFTRAIQEYPLNIKNYVGLVSSLFRLRLGRL